MAPRLAPLVLAAAVLTGCFGGDDDAVKRYESACAHLPNLSAAVDPRRDSGLTDAVDAIEDIDGEPAFVNAVRSIGDARAQLGRAGDVPSTVDLSDPYAMADYEADLLAALNNLNERYRDALAAARDAGIACPALASAGAAAPEPAPATPNETDVSAPAGLPATELAAFERGRGVLMRAGCLACHRVGDDGGDLGPNLTGIGDRQTRSQLARVLVRPISPMPSFRQLPARDRADLVTFMANLRG